MDDIFEITEKIEKILTVSDITEKELTGLVNLVRQSQAGAPKSINNFDQLVELKNSLGVRDDWHEPDEQDVNARVIGDHLDNAMGSTLDGYGELNVVITKDDIDVAVINLANLLSWACFR